jgi:NAD(P) transhydrogenase subunit alpha
MRIAVPKEIVAGERRVALVPALVAPLIKSGLEVAVEAGAGEGAFFADADYEKAGAKIVAEPAALYREAGIVLKVQRPTQHPVLGKHEVDLMGEGSVLISFLQPASDPDLVRRLVDRKITSLSMDTIPRISRAQSMDALSSQATVAGYKAVLIAAFFLGKFLPMLTTAAGTIRPAKVLVLGAGVAGLQAIATARRLGAVVLAFDVRPAVKEQVESLGAKFLQIELAEAQTEDEGGYARQLSEESHRREVELIGSNVKDVDAVITTALIPGKPAPRLISKEMVAEMRAGSVIVDLAAEAGGNCELTECGKEVVKNGVTIYGPVNLPSTMPVHASQMYARNVSELLKLLLKDGGLNLDFADEIIKGACVTHEGREMRS